MCTLKNKKTNLKTCSVILLLLFSVSFVQSATAQVQSQQEQEFIERLKELAWENYAMFEWHDLEYQRFGVIIRQRRLELFEAFTLNYNFFGIDSQNNFSPVVGLGFSVNLGRFFYTGARIRDARILRQQARAQKMVDRTQIAMEVIERYAFYKRSLELTELQAEALENNRQTMRMMQRQFEEGEVPLIEYQRAVDAFVEDSRMYITNKNDLLKGKLELEQLVGKRLEEIR
jgi:outer membrane protein TolC